MNPKSSLTTELSWTTPASVALVDVSQWRQETRCFVAPHGSFMPLDLRRRCALSDMQVSRWPSAAMSLIFY